MVGLLAGYNERYTIKPLLRQVIAQLERIERRNVDAIAAMPERRATLPPPVVIHDERPHDERPSVP